MISACRHRPLLHCQSALHVHTVSLQTVTCTYTVHQTCRGIARLSKSGGRTSEENSSWYFLFCLCTLTGHREMTKNSREREKEREREDLIKRMSNALWLWWWNSLKYNQTAEPNTNEQPALNEAVPKVFLLLRYRSMATGCWSVRAILCYFLMTNSDILPSLFVQWRVKHETFISHVGLTWTSPSHWIEST